VNHHAFSCLVLAVAAGCAYGQSPATPSSVKTYGAHLLSEAAMNHPDILAIQMNIAPASADGHFVVLSSRGLASGPPDPHVIEVSHTGVPFATFDRVTHHSTVGVPLLDVVGTRLGALIVTFDAHAAHDRSKLIFTAEVIRDELRRRTIEQSNLLDPFPCDPAFTNQTYGQHLIDAALAQNPAVLVLGIHAQPPDGTVSVIVASSFGRIGEKDDEGDIRIVRSSQPAMAVTPDGNRFNIGLPLKDMLGKTIGLLTVAFSYKKGDDRDHLLVLATQLRDHIGLHVLDTGSLVEPYPYAARYAAHIHAQDILEEALASHLHLLGLALHVTPPGCTKNVIIASTFGRIGKESDESDLQMIRSNKPNLAVWSAGHRFSGQVIQHDSSGHVIGSLLLIFPYKVGDDQADLLRQAESIEAELAAKTSSVQDLMVPVLPNPSSHLAF